MRGLVPRIHVFASHGKAWTTGSSPVETILDRFGMKSEPVALAPRKSPDKPAIAQE
jgi:hypothetical protein